jgi:hypothetical protein
MSQETCLHLWYTDEAKKEWETRPKPSPDSPLQFTPAYVTALSVTVNGRSYHFDLCLLCGQLKPMQAEEETSPLVSF